MTEKKPMPHCTPEQAGIPSASIEKYLRKLAEGRLVMHDVLVAADLRTQSEEQQPDDGRDDMAERTERMAVQQAAREDAAEKNGE